MVAIAHSLGRQVALLRLSFGCGRPFALLLLSPCLNPWGWQSAVGQSREHAIGSARWCGV